MMQRSRSVAAWTAGLATVATLLAAAPVHAAPYDYKFQMTGEEERQDPAIASRYTALYGACTKRARITSETAQCHVAEFKRQDDRLNATWKATLQRLPASRHAGLRAAQRRWVAQRDPFCRAHAAEFEGGTLAPVIYEDCRIEQTIRRTMWLERLKG